MQSINSTYYDFYEDFPEWKAGTPDNIFPYCYMDNDELLYLKLKYPEVIVSIETIDMI